MTGAYKRAKTTPAALIFRVDTRREKCSSSAGSRDHAKARPAKKYWECGPAVKIAK
jgi:hypothetical protein